MINKKNPANQPELRNCGIVGLFRSSNLQVTISRDSISVFKGRPIKEKSGRLRAELWKKSSTLQNSSMASNE